MATRFTATIDVVLKPAALPPGPAPDVVLAVTMDPATEIVGLGTKSVPFTVHATATVTFASVTIAKEGSAKDLLGASVRFDNFTVPAGGSFQNFLDLESRGLVVAPETVKVTIGGIA